LTTLFQRQPCVTALWCPARFRGRTARTGVGCKTLSAATQSPVGQLKIPLRRWLLSCETERGCTVERRCQWNEADGPPPCVRYFEIKCYALGALAHRRVAALRPRCARAHTTRNSVAPPRNNVAPPRHMYTHDAQQR